MIPIFNFISKYQTIYELLFHKSPDLASLRIFGSACYPFIRPYNHDKLDPRTTQCIFLGYALGYKGVICFSPKHHKLWISRHVIHDETCFPFKTFAQPLTSLVDPVTFFPSPSSYTTVFHIDCPSQMLMVNSVCYLLS